MQKPSSVSLFVTFVQAVRIKKVKKFGYMIGNYYICHIFLYTNLIINLKHNAYEKDSIFTRTHDAMRHGGEG